MQGPKEYKNTNNLNKGIIKGLSAAVNLRNH